MAKYNDESFLMIAKEWNEKECSDVIIQDYAKRFIESYRYHYVCKIIINPKRYYEWKKNSDNFY